MKFVEVREKIRNEFLPKHKQKFQRGKLAKAARALTQYVFTGNESHAARVALLLKNSSENTQMIHEFVAWWNEEISK